MARRSPTTPQRGWDLGASLGGSLSANGASPAADVSAGADVLGRVLGLRLAAVLTGWSETPLGAQAARWRRTSLTLAPRARRSLSFLTGELHAGPSLAWLQVEGRGFTAAETRREGALIFGMTGGARLALRGRACSRSSPAASPSGRYAAWSTPCRSRPRRSCRARNCS